MYIYKRNPKHTLHKLWSCRPIEFSRGNDSRMSHIERRAGDIRAIPGDVDQIRM